MAKRRTGIAKYLGNIVDDTRDFVDEVVDRARDVEHDMRDTISKAVANDEPDEPDEPEVPGAPGAEGLATAAELASLAAALASLTEKVDKLASLVAPLAGLPEKVDELASEQKVALGKLK